MTPSRKIALIQAQIDATDGGDPADFEAWRRKTEVVLRQLFGEGSHQHQNFASISYAPGIWFDGIDERSYRVSGVKEAVALLESAILEIELTSAQDNDPAEDVGTTAAGLHQRVFVVHGHNEALKATVESLILKLTGDQPIILHQQANQGRTLIEKFEESSSHAGFAVVLLTADDRGGPRDFEAVDFKARGRQNVVFEAGFFFGSLGRRRTAVLYESGVELPTDIGGLAYLEVDSGGGWKAKLATELDAAGIRVDWTALRIA